MATNDHLFGPGYGVIYGPPVSVAEEEEGEQAPTEEPIEEPPFLQNQGSGFRLRRISANLGDFDPDQFQATTREVNPNELVENRLNDLLAGDSRYIQQARRQGERAAAARGALSSSIFAGASEAAAIQAALPIAAQDAQTYYRTASENMTALNNMSLLQLQSATQIAATRMSVEVQANSRLMLQEMQNEHTRAMFELSMGHDTFMENLRQEGRIELADLGFYHRQVLTEMGFEHDINMSELTQEQRIELEERFGDPRFYANLEMQRSNVMSQYMLGMMGMYAQGMSQMNLADIDEDSFSRGEQFWSQLVASLTEGFSRIWGDDFPTFATGGN